MTYLLGVFHLLFAAATNGPDDEIIPALRPPRGEVAPSFWEQHGWWVAVTGVLVLGVVGILIWWLRRSRPPVLVPPVVQAREALASLSGQPETGELLSRVSQILRRYIAQACRLPPGEMTTADFCRALSEQGRLGAEQLAALGDFLRKCDERKFAQGQPASELGAVAQAQALISSAEECCARLPEAGPDPVPHSTPRAYRGATKA